MITLIIRVLNYLIRALDKYTNARIAEIDAHDVAIETLKIRQSVAQAEHEAAAKIKEALKKVVG